ncbi:MAG: hypothetical protein JNK16_01100 [Phycisphaerales bacterium]|nr:hypothetical protein [Phycisphaerales bacterium]
MNVQLMRDALTRVGALLAGDSEAEASTLVLTGAAAGMFGGILPDVRVTTDCDVIWVDVDARWARIEESAKQVAADLGLAPDWLNRASKIFLFNLALGWFDRCELVGDFGPLHVLRLSRFDLMAAKIVSAPRRSQDFSDLNAMRPTGAELDLLEEHLDRLETEDLDRQSFDRHRQILAGLRGRL